MSVECAVCLKKMPTKEMNGQNKQQKDVVTSPHQTLNGFIRSSVVPKAIHLDKIVFLF